MLQNITSRLKGMLSRNKSQLSGEFGKDAMKRRATGGVRGDIARKQAEAESSVRRNVP